MKILFKSVDIENFMSIGNAFIQLEDAGYTLVSGVNNNPDDLAKSNGSGKSSIFEAIVWCLTGSTMRGNKNIVNVNSDGGTLVQLEFECDDKSYKLIRSKDHHEYKTNLKIYVDGEDISGKGIRDSEKLLVEYLSDLTPSLIGSVIILGQGLPNRFTHNSPSGRKDVLEKLCKSDFMIVDLKDRINHRRLQLNSLLREQEDSIVRNQTKLSVSIESLGKCKAELMDLQNDFNFDGKITSCELSRNEYVYDLEKDSAEYSALESQRDIKTNISNDLVAEKYAALAQVTAVYQPQIDALKERLSAIKLKRDAARAELHRIQNITDVCPTCGQKLLEVHKPDTTDIENSISEYNAEILSIELEQQNIMGESSSKQEEVSNMFSDKQSACNTELTDIKSSMSRLEGNIICARDKIRQLDYEIETLRYRRDTHSESLQRVQSEIKSTQDVIDMCESEIENSKTLVADYNNRLDIISKFNTAVTRDFRGYLLTNVITFINETAKKYSRCIFETELIEFVLDGNNISISYNGKEYEALSGGERQKVDLIVQFSIRDMLCKHTGFSTNLLVLDEIFDNLDDVGCNKVLDLISEKLVDISSIYIITHHNNYLSIPSDNEIIITKDVNGVSYIQ